MIARKIIYIVLVAMLLMSLGMAPQTDASSLPKERLVWPPPPSEPKIEFLYSISGPGDLEIKKGFFRRLWEVVAGESREGLTKPFGVFADDRGKLFVADTADQSVHVFDQRDERYFVIENANKHHFASPIAVAVDGEGRIYVSDSVARRVYVFNEKGDYLSEIGEDSQMERPTGMAIDKVAGTLYVVDTVGCKVLVYKLDGRYIGSFGGPGPDEGQFNRPTFIAIGRDGNLYITDTLNVRVQIIDRDGKFVSQFGKRGDGTGDLANPRGIAVDADGNVYITDTVFEAVQIFDKSGQLLLVFGRRGTGNGEFSLPAGISTADDRIYVADSYNSRVQVFKYLKAGK